MQDYTYDGIGNLKTANETRDTRVAGRTAKTKNDLYAPAVLGVNEVGDQVARIGTVGTGPAAGTTAYTYDLRDHLTTVTQGSTVVERLWYGPGGELVTRQVGEAFTFYVGSYGTVRARGATGCTTACEPVAGTEEEEAHVLLAGTRLASVSGARTLYYYRSRLGSVVATSLNGGRAGARYRYDLYGKVMAAENETSATRSELGYTDALKLSGDLIYLKARVYDAGARVFLQADGVDRQRYAYVWGDPVNLSDPTGMEPTQMQAWGRLSYGQMMYPRDLSTTGSWTAPTPPTKPSTTEVAQQAAASSPVTGAERTAEGTGTGLSQARIEVLEQQAALDATRIVREAQAELRQQILDGMSQAEAAREAWSAALAATDSMKSVKRSLPGGEAATRLYFEASKGVLTMADGVGNILTEAVATNSNARQDGWVWRPGTYAFSHHVNHQSPSDIDSYGHNGNFVFAVEGHEGVGVHAGKDYPQRPWPFQPLAPKTAWKDSLTMGCIRTTNAMTREISERHYLGAPVRSITILP